MVEFLVWCCLFIGRDKLVLSLAFFEWGVPPPKTPNSGEVKENIRKCLPCREDGLLLNIQEITTYRHGERSSGEVPKGRVDGMEPGIHLGTVYPIGFCT